MIPADIFFIILAYILGSIPVGVIITRSLSPETDLQKEGSGNIGATNVSRLIGRTAGIMTLAGDILKGFIAVLLTRLFVDATLSICLVMLAAFLGHCFSIFLKFRGGKGVATTYGIYLAVSPLIAVFAMFVNALVIYFGKISSLGSLIGMTTLFVIFLFSGFPFLYVVTTAIIVVLVFYRHRTNIKELMEKWKS
ncbi:glycerol-3-phosphate 1-O-acyltransferase PlsY [Bdellovibrionota bacterium]